MQRFKFEDLANAPLIIDAIYEGGKKGNAGDDPLSKLLPKVGNQGGFRYCDIPGEGCEEYKLGKCPAFVVLYTSGEEYEWPDYLDYETGIFHYYGDNRNPGHELHDTPKKGNVLLKFVFQNLHQDEKQRRRIPPFFIFQKAGEGRDVQFLGLAIPGNKNLPQDHNLIAIWRTKFWEKRWTRFQNYEAYFTVLDTRNDPIKREWVTSLKNSDKDAISLAPKSWKLFIEKGIGSVQALQAPKIRRIRNKDEQLPHDYSGKKVIHQIVEYFKEEPFAFEKCAVEIVKMMDSNFIEFDITRPWRDGGRDAIGKYTIGTGDDKLSIECALEAKCYGRDHGVGVKQASRLISRIRHRQFGILVVTSYLDSQAYEEIKEDQHPILIISAKDIVEILRKGGKNENNILEWLGNFK
jgi:hypothetical protein